MESEMQETIKKLVASEPFDEALKLIYFELKQSITWTISYIAAAHIAHPEEASLDQAIQSLHSMNNFIVNDLIVDALLPRLKDLKHE